MNLLSGVDQDYHRPQTTPGGYEWWHFDGTDDSAALSFSAQFYAGHLLSPYYQESLAAYWKGTKSPLVSGQAPIPPNPSTHSVRSGQAPTTGPPNPLEYTGVIFRVFHKGNLIGEFLDEFDPGMLKASDHSPAVLLGPNRFNWLADGNPPSYALTLQGPIKNGRQSLRARLFFTPEKMNIPTLSPSEDWPTHTWILAAPRCHVEGTLEWCNADGDVKQEKTFVGKGYHDHHFGSVPPGQFVKAWHWGRAFLGAETLIYSVQVPVDDKESPWGFLFTASKGEAQYWKVSYKLSQGRRNVFWLPYFKKLGFTDAHSLEVIHRQVLSDGPSSLTFEDRVSWQGEGKALQGTGQSQYLYLPRLGSRLFSPMIKGMTVKMAKPLSNITTNDPPSGDVTTERPNL